MSQLGLYLDLTGNVTACGKAWSKARTTPGAAVTAEELVSRTRISNAWSRGDTVVKAFKGGFSWALKVCSLLPKC
jgi:hypothetical protein